MPLPGPELTRVSLQGADFSLARQESRGPADDKTWAFLNSYLAANPEFPQDAKVVTSLQKRLDLLLDGRKARMIVAHGDPDAFSIPGHVVVTDGILQLLNSEEIDALLAHESTHLAEGHVDDHPTSSLSIRGIGKQRAHETMADLIPALELLDKKGLNPNGMITLMEKMETYMAEKDNGEGKIPDVVHGSLLDRRLNISQLLWLIDVRNLSHIETPSEFTPEDFDEYDKPETSLSQYETLDPILKRRIIESRVLQINKDLENASPVERISLVEDLKLMYKMQQELLKEAIPQATTAELENLTLLIFGKVFKVSNIPLFRDVAGIHYAHWLTQFTDRGNLKNFLTNLPIKDLSDLGISLDQPLGILETDYKTSLSRDALEAYFLSIDLNNLSEADATIKDIFGGEEPDFLVQSLVGALKKKGNLVRVGPALAEILSNTSIDTENIAANVHFALGFKRTTPEENIEDWIRTGTSETQLAYFITDKVINARIQKIRKLTDPIEVFRQIDEYFKITIQQHNSNANGYYGINLTRDMATKIQSFVGETVKKYPPEKILPRLEPFSRTQSNPMHEIPFIEFMSAVYRGEYDLKRDVKTEKLPDHFTFLAATTSKEKFLESASADIEEAFKNKKLSRKNIEELVSLIMETPQRVRALGLEVDWDFSKTDFSKMEFLLKSAKTAFMAEAVKSKNPAVLTDLLRILPVYNIQTESNDQWQLLLNKTLEGNAGSVIENWKQLFILSCLSEDFQVLYQIPSQAAREAVRNMSFDEGMNFVFSEYNHLPRNLFTEAIQVLIEEKARTLEDFAKLDSTLAKEVTRFFEDDEAIGRLAVADAALDPYRTYSDTERRVGVRTYSLKGFNSNEFLSAMLETRDNDKPLKQYLFDRWFAKNRLAGSNSVRTAFDIEQFLVYRTPGKQAQLNHWLNQPPPSSREGYTPLSKTVTDLYLSGSPMIYALLRKTLVGPGGVLSTAEGKQQLTDALYKNWVDFGDSEGGEQMLRQIVDSLFEKGNQAELYERISPLLADMVLKYPQNPHSYREIAIEFARQKISEWVEGGQLINPSEQDVQILSKRVHYLMTRDMNPKNELLDINDSTAKLFSIFKQEDKTRPQPYSPWKLAIMVGQKSSAVGVKMLQQSGQYFEVPAEVKDDLMNSYDDMKGQSRLQAYRTIMREAELFPQMASFVDQIAEIYPRIGGGSLFTVYEVRLKNGKREALAVRNPNAKYHVESVVGLTKKALKDAAEKDPDNKYYPLLEILLGEANNLVADELSDPNFEQKDELFRAQNDSSSNGFNPGKNRYKVLVPKSEPTGTRWIRRDQLIEGKNFTSLNIKDGETDINAGVISREDYRQATSLLTRVFIYELLITGLVHSDVHPGNFRVTSDNQFSAVFDRYNLLELPDGEKKFFKGMITSYMRSGTNGIRNHVVDYLLALEENSSFQKERSRIVQDLAEKSGANNSLEQTIQKSIISLKQRGVKIPGHFGPILTGLQFLNRMSEQAGFKGVIDSFNYTSSMMEKMSLVM